MRSPLPRVLFLCGVLLAFLSSAGALNLDVITARVFSQPDSGPTASGNAGLASEFGASVTFHQAGTDYGVLVGAPRASYTDSQWTIDMPDVKRPGVLYWCLINATSPCRQLPVDTEDELPPVDPSPLSHTDNLDHGTAKSDMRLGETVVSLGPNETALVCASRYRQVWPCIPANGTNDGCLGNPNKTFIDDPVGKCITIKPSLMINAGDSVDNLELGGITNARSEYKPLYTQWDEITGNATRIRYTNIGLIPLKTSLLGLSLQARRFSTDAKDFPRDEIVVGAPFAVLGTGQAWTTKLVNSSLESWKQVDYVKRERRFTGGGLSVTLGDFDGPKTGGVYIAHGRPVESPVHNPTPQPDNPSPYVGLGEVIIHNTTDAIKTSISNIALDKAIVSIRGFKIGECFGCSLLAVDVNNDTLEELLVGAPHFYGSVGIGEAGGYEFGRVYVYSTAMQQAVANYQGTTQTLTEMPSAWLDGFHASRFGTTLARAGDLDKDGFQDVLIGAPLEPNGQHKGAVYVFRGSANGLISPYSQRIAASDLTSSPMRGFGYSIGDYWDIDGNGFNDMVVGAPYSNQAVVLKARPVVTINRIRLDVPAEVDSISKACQHNGTGHACFQKKVCSTFGLAIQPVSVRIQVTLSVSNTLMFDLTKSTQATVYVNMTAPGTEACSEDLVVLIQPSARQLCRPSMVSVLSWSFIEQPSTATELSAVLSKAQNGPSLPTSPIKLIKECPSCHPNLRTNVTNVTIDGIQTKEIYLGVSQQVVVTGYVENIGSQIACQPTITLKSTEFLGATITTFSDGWECGATGQTSLSCVHSSGRFFPSDKANFQGILTLTNLNKSHLATVEARLLNVSVNINSFNNEIELADNPSLHELNIFNQATMSLSLTGLTQTVDFNNKIINDANPTSTAYFRLTEIATFQVNNFGPGVTTAADILLTFPFQTTSGKYLYYMADIDATVAGVRCNHSNILNPLEIGGGTFRKRRSNVGSYPKSPVSYKPDKVYKDCTGKICMVSIECQVPPVAPSLTGGIRIFWSVWTSTFQSEGLVPVDLNFTLSFLNISEDAGFKLIEPRPTDVTESTSYRDARKGKESAETWPIIVAIIGGILLLLVIVLILWKSGFFKKPDARRDSEAAMSMKGTSTSGGGADAAPAPEPAADAMNGTKV